MSRSRAAWIRGLAFFAIACGVVLALVAIQRVSVRHNTPLTKIGSYERAVELGAVAAGWIPPWVPESAVEIAERHGTEGRYERLGFRVPADDVGTMVFRIRMQQFKQITDAGSIPEDLTTYFGFGASRNAGVTFFGREGLRGAFVERIAIDAATGTVLYWADPADPD